MGNPLKKRIIERDECKQNVLERKNKKDTMVRAKWAESDLLL